MRRHLPSLLMLATALSVSACASAPATPPAAEAAAPPAAPSMSDTLATRLAEAQQLRGMGDYDGAIHILAQLTLVYPDDARVIGEYGKALVQEGRAVEASNFLQRAVELDSQNWTYLSALGVAESARGHAAAAAQDFRKALALKPDEPSVLNNLAIALSATGRLTEAEDLLRQAAAATGSTPQIEENLRHIAELRASAEPPRAAPRPPKPEPVVKRALPPALAATPEATHSPRQIVSDASRAGAQAPQGNAAPAVIMAKIPDDPLAGKHYPDAAQKHAKKLAEAAPKPAPSQETAKPQNQAPALRTAADIY